jgi:hypothetical protein
VPEVPEVPGVLAVLELHELAQSTIIEAATESERRMRMPRF